MNPYQPPRTEQKPDPETRAAGRIFFGGFVALLVYAACSLIATWCNAQQIMSPAKLQAVRAALPILADETANAKLHSPEVIWYSTAELPAVHQMRNERGLGRCYFLLSSFNISGDPTDAGLPGFGTWANEFPWTAGKPGGAHRAASVTSVKGFYFPQPAVCFERTVPGDPDLNSTDVILDWVFAEGSYFVEVIMQRLNGYDTVFEVRSREKSGRSWDVDVHRPFATADQLAESLEQMEGGKYRQTAIAYLKSDIETVDERLVDSTHDVKRAFDVTAQPYPLPTIDSEHILQLLDRPFTSVLGEAFHGEATGPVNRTGFANIVPHDYFSAHITSTGTSLDCSNCHNSAGRHGMEFQKYVMFNGRRVRRGAYGHIGGSYSDLILSWYPVAPSSISTNGFRTQTRLRQSWVNAGLVRMLEGRTLPEGYLITEHVE